jgi:hypothetical protein
MLCFSAVVEEGAWRDQGGLWQHPEMDLTRPILFGSPLRRLVSKGF